MRALIHVQHLLGVGHLQRATEIAEALCRTGFAVTLASGGKSAPRALDPRIDFHQLPAASAADGSFSELLDENGSPVDDDWRKRRTIETLRVFHQAKPDVLITEGFPFARRMLRFELLSLLGAACEHCSCRLVVSSIRDILQPKDNLERNAETLRWLDTYYDRVLVHGDEQLAGLDYSFPPAFRIADKIAYTGYIGTDPVTDNTDIGRDEVIVSAGGSDTGFDLLQTAIAARPLSSLATARWRILVSPTIDGDRFDSMHASSHPGVIVERNRTDFPALLARARLSISQAGYNTVTDLLRTRTPAVLVPFADAGEREQTMRATLLQQRGRVTMVEQDKLSPESLAAAIDVARDQNTSLDLRLDGARRSAELIRGWLENKADSL